MSADTGIDWSVYLVVDPEQCREGRDFMSTVRAAIKGGASVVQLRDKMSTDRQLVERARRLREECQLRGAACIVNDRVDVALAAEADGVHLGPEDMAIEDAADLRSSLGLGPEEFVIGGSAGTPARARRLVSAGADYLGVGAMYDASPSKPDASAPRGPEALSVVRDAVDVPIVGIGGITAQRASEVIDAGADGVAVIRAICQATNPQAAAGDLSDSVKESLDGA